MLERSDVKFPIKITQLSKVVEWGQITNCGIYGFMTQTKGRTRPKGMHTYGMLAFFANLHRLGQRVYHKILRAEHKSSEDLVLSRCKM